MRYRNTLGGRHLFGVRNIDSPYNTIRINVTVTNPSATAINNGDMQIFFDRDTNGNYDVQVISAEDYGVGTATVINGDSETPVNNDVVTWDDIPITGSGTANLTILLNITQGYQIGASTDMINLDFGDTTDAGVNYTYTSNGALFSRITVSDKFARGPVRQGVDLSANAGYWYIRGFIRNLGASTGAGEFNLTYNVSVWRMYDVNAGTGAPQNILQKGEFNQSGGPLVTPADGRIYTTNDSRSSNISLYNSSSQTKPYIAVYFEWEVVWNSSNSENNRTYINTTMDLPRLYVVDLTMEEAIYGTVSPEVGGENITIYENLTNVGSTQVDPPFVQILSTIPSNTTDAEWRGIGW